MTINTESSLDFFQNDERSRVFQIIPDCYKDNRGYFMEVFKDISDDPTDKIPLWLKNLNWIKQINRSSSSAGVIRGCHAQKGKFCQGKLVEAINENIYDIITDARPDSESFGASMIFLLDAETHNKLWVPRGFLHAFVVPISTKNPAIFEYYCDNVYSHVSEIGVNPSSLLPKVVEKFKEIIGENDKYNDLYETFSSDEKIYSEKDVTALEYNSFMNEIKEEYAKTGKVWYK